MKGCFFLAGTGNVSHLDAFREGKFYVQDPAARLAAMCAEVKPGMQVLDSCAAPGGKSFACAIEMENCGRVLACDLHAHKIALIAAGAERLGLSCVEAIGQDARDEVPQWRRQMDAVLVDAPCSGLGVIRKKPDIRYKELTQTGKLPALQLELLRRQAEYVKLGGVLLYCTCTLLRRENQDVVQQFLQGNEDFGLERLTLPKEVPEDTPGMTTLLPCDTGTDGFFICKMRRNH
jgi:16S rRNA (cytosine967-C5)-methyltransferase